MKALELVRVYQVYESEPENMLVQFVFPEFEFICPVGGLIGGFRVRAHAFS